MKILAAIMAATAIVGCSKGFLASHSTGFSESTDKSALAYLQCLEPKWQAPATSVCKIKTRTGYTLEVSAVHTGPIALAVVNQETSRASIDVFLPTAQGRAERWKDAARECL